MPDAATAERTTSTTRGFQPGPGPGRSIRRRRRIQDGFKRVTAPCGARRRPAIRRAGGTRSVHLRRCNTNQPVRIQNTRQNQRNLLRAAAAGSYLPRPRRRGTRTPFPPPMDLVQHNTPDRLPCPPARRILPPAHVHAQLAPPYPAAPRHR
jgi:hypothetical protein